MAAIREGRRPLIVQSLRLLVKFYRVDNKISYLDNPERENITRQMLLKKTPHGNKICSIVITIGRIEEATREG
jgi:hypothetical protein